MFEIAAVCLSITALLAYVNARFVHLPTSIGVMAAALALSVFIVALNAVGVAQELFQAEKRFVGAIDFSQVLLNGMLSVLLFAGAMRANVEDFLRYRREIAGLAVLGTLASTVLVGAGIWAALHVVGAQLSLLHCLIFGALISPTDPVAVVGIARSAGAPANLEAVITGESLFNDAVGIVVFLLLAAMAGGEHPDAGDAMWVVAREAGGGILLGAVLGYVTYRLLKSIDQYEVEVLITLATVIGGYALADHLEVSGPLTMVTAGLVVGSRGRSHGMSDRTRQQVDTFWNLLDEILNALLFVLIGMEVLQIELRSHLVPGVLAILVTLLARLLTVGVPIATLCRHIDLPHGSWKVLTWGGLRGGISVALALSLPRDDARDAIVALTYCVVIFSILVQGLSIARVVKRALKN